MGWFSEVPFAIEIGSKQFVVADEAIERAELGLAGPDGLGKQGERPDPDWPAMSLLLIAQLQLDQAVSILSYGFGIDAHVLSGVEVSRRLERAFHSIRGGQKVVEDYAFEIDEIGDGVDLWRALREASKIYITHAFEYDGSITLTLGPELPELCTLGIEASEGAEMNADPALVFAAAVGCTNDVAELAVRYRRWSTEGYVSDPTDTNSKA